MSEHTYSILIFIAWLTTSLFLCWIADKLERYIKNRRPRSAKRKAAQRKTHHTLIIEGKGGIVNEI